MMDTFNDLFETLYNFSDFNFKQHMVMNKQNAECSHFSWATRYTGWPLSLSSPNQIPRTFPDSTSYIYGPRSITDTNKNRYFTNITITNKT